MISTKQAWFAAVFLILSLFLISARVSTASTMEALTPTAAPVGHIATDVELASAEAEWAQSAHADTFDNGMGANTTCARCKSPLNWDPSREFTQTEAQDCAACKRVPGAPRPELLSGVDIAEGDWRDIPCEVCHIPVDGSFYTGIAFWNQALGQYEPVESVIELCAYCHEGQHGFEVIEEQEASRVHVTMQCTGCHGAHGAPSSCEDCHDPAKGLGAPEHVRHPKVNCTACHDAGNLSIWYENDPQSKHYGEYIPRRFAHTLTSWPSHNLTIEVWCQRCHHPINDQSTAIAAYVKCDVCHEHKFGAVWVWCENFDRNTEPNTSPTYKP